MGLLEYEERDERSLLSCFPSLLRGISNLSTGLWVLVSRLIYRNKKWEGREAERENVVWCVCVCVRAHVRVCIVKKVVFRCN